jgi:serine/threonine protein kinase/Tol biopolymer transport system component
MTLAAGERLGRYEILGDLGAGGMGEVYRARDTTLDRDVAVKVLPETMARDSNRVIRFEREAKAVAKLAHPNIVEIWDYASDGGVSYAVTELLEGETLRDRLSRGPLEWSTAAVVGSAIAEGLAAAHQAGIVHRDLKPSNVFLTSDGRVKVLDFGLASVRSPAVGQDCDEPGSTFTEKGAVVGTVGYMAPEQVRGEPADNRSDIFAFGCVMYEAVTGKRAFDRETAAETMAAILNEEPAEMSSDGVVQPLELERTVMRCLAKRPDERFQSATDLAHTLRDISSISEPAPIRLLGRGRRRGFLLSVGAVATVAIAIALSGRLIEREPEPRPVRRYSIVLPQEAPLAPSNFFNPEPPLALSPDGDWLVYVARFGNTTRLMRRRLDGLEVEPIESAEIGVSSPFFSPDGQWVGFRRFGQGPEKILLTGQYPPMSLRDPANSLGLYGAVWQNDGNVVFAGGNPPGIYRVPEDGGATEPVILVDFEAGESRMAFPEPLPGNKGLLFTRFGHFGEVGKMLAVMDSSTAEIRGAMHNVPYGRYASSGHVVFPQEHRLMAVAFDVDSLSFTGEPVDVSEPGMGARGLEPHEWAFSQNGTLVYAPMTNQPNPRKTLVVVDRDGGEKRVPLWHSDTPRLSPDGRYVAAGVMSQEHWWSVAILDLETGARHDITRGEDEGSHPMWTPDGRRIVFTKGRGETGDLYWKPVFVHGGEAERLTEMEFASWPFAHSLSADGATLFFFNWATGEEGGALWALHLDGTQRRVERVTQSRENLSHPAISPDGEWLAFLATAMVRVSPYPEMDRYVPVTDWSSNCPMWHPDGGSIFFLDGEGRLMEAEVRTDPELAVGRPALVLEGPFDSFDVAADGDRFLAVKVHRGEPITELVVVENWFEELKRKAPPSR